jgi:hypothetical protein
MEANKNFAKWLSCGIQISGTFGLHHVVYKLYETDHEARLNFVNWHFLGMHDGQVNPKLILFSSKIVSTQWMHEFLEQWVLVCRESHVNPLSVIT